MSGTDSSRREPLSRRSLTGPKLRERALDLLSRRDHSRVELRQKLIQKGAQVEEIGPLLDELEGLGYLDDRRFAENFVRFRAGKAWGRRRYGQELAKRGVDSEIVKEILETTPELTYQSMDEKLRRLVERELSRGKEPDKVAASLARKGFALPAIRGAMQHFQD